MFVNKETNSPADKYQSEYSDNTADYQRQRADKSRNQCCTWQPVNTTTETSKIINNREFARNLDSSIAYTQYAIG